MPDTPAINTANRFAVGMSGDKLFVLLISKIVPGLTRDDAFNLAAYLITMAEALPGDTKFDDVRQAIENA